MKLSGELAEVRGQAADLPGRNDLPGPGGPVVKRQHQRGGRRVLVPEPIDQVDRAEGVVRSEDAVVIAEQQPLSARSVSCGISRGPCPAMTGQPDGPDRHFAPVGTVGVQNGLGVVGRAVVGDDDLGQHVTSLAEQAV